jgi:glycosyltransferase involved in cell wall biosynthesis
VEEERSWARPEKNRPTGSERPALSLTIPLYDEEGNVERVVEALLEVFRTAEIPFTLILVDNGSSDGTRAIVQQLERGEAEVRGLYLDKNQGYGGGILAGMAVSDTPVLGYLWGDGQVGAEDVLRVYRRLVADNVDISKARRVQRMDGWQRTLVSRVYNTAALWLFHVTSTDANGCPKIFTREAWEQLGPPTSSDWFLDPEIMIGVAEEVMKLAEVDVVARARDFGVSKVGVRTIIEFAFNMLRRRARGR